MTQQRFPLIQLPRKSEDKKVIRFIIFQKVSINSTSEEVRSDNFFVPSE